MIRAATLLLLLGVPALANASKSGVEPSRLSLPEGPGSIQGLGEDPEPNLTMGLAGYGVPISLPAGYAGHSPRLRLGYSSGGGAGVAGMGWSIGVPYLERMTRYGLPRYTRSDRIASGGAGELVHTGNGVYRAREEGGFVRFTWVEGATDHWVAEYPDGRRAYFGATELGARDNTARISVTGAGEEGSASGTYRWCVTAETDRLGHVIRYEHRLIDGYPYVERIAWAYSDGPGASGTPEYEAFLDYETRQDIILDGKPGREVEMTQRLTGIRVYVGGALLRRYEIVYEPYAIALGMSRIAAVNTYGLDDDVPYGVKFSFGYTGAGELPFLVSMGSVGVDFRTGNAELLDINGDGLPDVVDSSEPTQQFFINTPTADRGALLSVPYASEVAVAGGANLASPRVQPLDVDGDGFTDLVDGSNRRTLKNTGTGDWSSPVATDFALPDFENNPNLRFFDYDHDRRSDAVLVTDAGTFYYPNRAGSGFDPTGITADAIGVTLAEGLRFADMNGDGMQDAVQFLPGSGARYRPYLGYGRFGPWREMLGLESSGLTVSGNEVELVDVNLDGASDVVIILADEVFCFLNVAGAEFREVSLPTQPSNSEVPLRESDTTLRFADMNGNGSRDIVYISPSGRIDVLELFPVRAHLLAEIRNGIGKTNRMTYSTSAAEMARDGGPSAWTYRMPQPSVVLKELTVSDAHSGTTSRQTFVYRNGYYDGEDNQFNGFQDVEVHTPDDGTTEAGVTYNVFDVGDGDRYFKGKLVSSRVTSSGRDLSFTSTLFDDCPLEAGLNGLTPAVRYICALEVSVEHREGTGPEDWVQTRTVNRYDAFGNITRSHNEGVVSVGGEGCDACERAAPQGEPCGGQCTGDELITDTEFTTPMNPGDPWILRMPYRVQTRTVDSPDALATEVLTYYDGPDFEGLPLGKVQVGLTVRVQERETAERLITRGRNRYDVHGNLLETVDGRGFSSLLGYDDASLRLTSETRTGLTDRDGPYSLRMEVSHHPVLELIGRSSNWYRVRDDSVVSDLAYTDYGYSQYGELTAVAAPGDSLSAPTTTYTYSLTSPISRIVERRRSVQGSAFDIESVQCFDGRGRAFQQVSRVGEGRYFVEGYSSYSGQGSVARNYQPYESTTNGCANSAPATTLFNRMSYDAIGRATAKHEPDQSIYGSESVTTTRYRPLESAVYDPEDNDESSPYFQTPATSRTDGLGRVVAISRYVESDSAAVTLKILYDELGRLAGLQDDFGYQKLQGYDTAGRIVEERDPDRGRTAYEYDDTDNLVRRVDARSVATVWTYDAVGRTLTQTDENDSGSRIEYRYDAPVECDVSYATFSAGKRVEVSFPTVDRDGSRSRGLDCAQFDARNRISRSERQVVGTRFVSTTRYDNADRMVATTLPTGRVVNYVYDALSRVIAVAGLIDEIDYSERGEFQRIQRANGTVDTMRYDVRQRLEAIGVDAPNGSLLSRQLIRNRVSLVTHVDDLLFREPGVPTATAEYEYDAAYRLVEADFPASRPTPPNASGFSRHATTAETVLFGYDATDNLVSKTSSLGYESNAHVGEFQYESQRPHAVTSAGSVQFSYDPAGNTTAIGQHRYEWDYRHKLVSASTGSEAVGVFSYDGDGQRVLKQEGPSTTIYVSPSFQVRDGVATTWISGMGSRLVKLESNTIAAHVLPDVFPLTEDGLASEPDGRLSIGDAWVLHARREGILPSTNDSTAAPAVAQTVTLESMLQAVARSVAVGDGEQQTHLHPDPTGSTALTTDESGALLSESLHYPYGEWRYRSDDRLEDYSFTGVERDASTGLSANGARYLHLGVGRFTSPDPFFQDLEQVLNSSPWEYNAYSYAAGNPISNADPDGKNAVTRSRVVAEAIKRGYKVGSKRITNVDFKSKKVTTRMLVEGGSEVSRELIKKVNRRFPDLKVPFDKAGFPNFAKATHRGSGRALTLTPVNIGKFVDRKPDINKAWREFQRVTEATSAEIAKLRKKYTMHHDIEDGRLIPVDIEVHDVFKHTGGDALRRAGFFENMNSVLFPAVMPHTSRDGLSINSLIGDALEWFAPVSPMDIESQMEAQQSGNPYIL